jgi:hypothetical protein
MAMFRKHSPPGRFKYDAKASLPLPNPSPFMLNPEFAQQSGKLEFTAEHAL